MMALHPHLINPNHHLPRATQKSQRRFWPRAPCHARLCDRLNLRASPLTSHCAGGRRGASSAFAEPLTVQSLASAATLSPCQQRRPVDPWARGKLVGARERTSRRRPAAPAVSRLMQRDLHPRHPPWPHGWHVAPGPRQDVVGWERLLLFRTPARKRPSGHPPPAPPELRRRTVLLHGYASRRHAAHVGSSLRAYAPDDLARR